jgi:hypothetical protein
MPPTVAIEPVGETVAIPTALLLHVPPAVKLITLVVNPWHTLAGPIITPGTGKTFNVEVTRHPAAEV